MLMYFVSDHYSDQLCDPCKEQVSMESFLILCFTPGKPKAVFEVVDGTFYCGPDLVSAVPLVRSPKSTGIGPQILFGIKIDHPAAAGRSTGIFAVTDTAACPRDGILFPFDFRADKFILGNAAPEFAGSFIFHREGYHVGKNRVLVHNKNYGSDTGVIESGLDAELLDELARSGAKYNPDDVVAIIKTADGKLVWLENGTENAGLNHIIAEHANDFFNKGIVQEEIPNLEMINNSQFPVKEKRYPKQDVLAIRNTTAVPGHTAGT